MSDEESPRDAELSQVRFQLHSGLRSCRTVVASYRAFLAGEPHAETPVNDDAPPVTSDAQSPFES